VIDPQVVNESSYKFPDLKEGKDALFFFRMHDKPSFVLPEKTFFIPKSVYS